MFLKIGGFIANAFRKTLYNDSLQTNSTLENNGSSKTKTKTKSKTKSIRRPKYIKDSLLLYKKE